MGQPVKLSDSLVLDARVTGEVTERSIAGQIEFWAGLGRAIEPLLRGDKVMVLKRLGSTKPLSDCLKQIGLRKGRQQLAKVLLERPFPHYEALPGRPGLIVRTSKDGKRITGRFQNRNFVPAA